MNPLPDDWQQNVALRISPRARHVRLSIDRRGRIELVLPRGVDVREASVILARHHAWVEKTLHRMAPRLEQASLAPQHIELAAIGQNWQVDYLHQGRGRYHEPAPNRLSLRQGEDWPAALRRWLAAQGRHHLPPWLEAVSRELALPFQGVTIRGQKTRWGSCSAKGNISLNYALMLLPPEQVRYLLIHELCHTVHLNHSRAFWSLVERHCRDYRLHDRALRGAMSGLPVWLHD